jgi:Zn-dependent M16 (insulinase) family peptidase
MPVTPLFSPDLQVYIDAVFNPLAVRSERGREIFRQEGHRLELDDPDSSSPTLTGVVYQEMKGNYSSADTVASRTAARCLFDNGKSTYAVESGGHPEDIPALTYESFIDFHNRKYHPSNCRFFVYGDDAQTLQQSMDLVNNAIQDFEPRSVEDTMVKAQPLWTEGKFIQEPYPASEDETKRYVYVNWLLQEQPLQDDKRLIWEMLNHLLLGTSAAPLRKALEESGYGDRVMGDGLEDELYQPFFSIGLKGVEAENVREVEQLIYSTLERVANEGFSRKSMEASQHAIEFALRENNTGRIPQGMAAMMASLTNWIYDRDPLAPLRWEQPLADLKERLFEHDEDPFTPMIKEGLLSNNHTVTLEMYPDPNFGGNIEQREESYVEDATSSMSRDDAEKLVQETQELRRRQQEPDDPETRNLIPTLNIDDLPKTPKSVPTNVDQQDGYELVTHPIFTRGLAYADVLLDLHAVPSRLLPLVPTFCNALTEVGSQDMSPDDLQMRINSKTGGVSFSPTVSSVKYSNDPAAYIACRGKAVTDRSSDMFSILHDILHGAQLDNRNKVKQLVLESKSAMEQRVISAGHTIAASRIGAMNTLAGFVNEQMNGVSQLQFLRELAERVDSDWDGVRDDLEEIRRTLLNKANGKVNITAGEDDLSTVVRSANGFMETIQNNPSNGSDWLSISMLPKKNEALVVPTTVNYVGKGALLYDFGYQHHGASTAINKAISMSYRAANESFSFLCSGNKSQIQSAKLLQTLMYSLAVWDQVRASGGAYGVFGSFNAQSGMETMVSFRDPNFARTLDVYDGASNYLRTSELSDDEVTRSVIGAIGDLDKHELPVCPQRSDALHMPRSTT